MAATGMAAMVGTVLMAGPASAHTPKWSVTCDSVQVDLTSYSTARHVTNSVSLTIVGGEGALADDPDFGASFHFEDALPPHDAPLTLHLVVKAGDDSEYNVDDTKVSPVCDKPTTPPVTPSTTPPTTATTTPATTAPPTTAPTTTAAPTSTTTAPVVADTTSPAAGGDLAETGSSSATPMIAGIAVAVVVVGGGLVFWTRRRGSSSHR